MKSLPNAALLALALLAGALFSPANAVEIEMVPPTEIIKETGELKDAVAANRSAPELRFRAAALFDDVQAMHHLPVSGIGKRWAMPEQILNDNQQKAKPGDLVEAFTVRMKLMTPSVPDPTEKERQQHLLDSYLQGISLDKEQKLRESRQGELADNVAGAYTWDLAKREMGQMLLNNQLLQMVRYLGEFAVATLAHESRHALDHASGKLDGKHVIDSEVSAFETEYTLLKLIDPTGWKMAALWIQTVERKGVPENVKAYVKHLHQVRAHGDKGTLKDYVIELGYQDKDGGEHEHKHFPGDGHFHS